MLNLARIIVRREAGGQHGNISTPSPPQHQDDSTPGSESSGNTTAIVIGVVVPLVIIGIGALVVYIWYRKKYPVRMVVGKDFGKFSNPAYSKRHSTLTLVKEDGHNYWDTFQPSGISNPGLSLVIEDEEDGAQHFQSQTIQASDETDAAVKIENIEKMMHSGSVRNNTGKENGNDIEQHDAIMIAETTEENMNDETPSTEIKEVKEEKPRKALLVRSESENNASFEVVTESDFEPQTESETSSTIDSTGTHTIVISGNELSETDKDSDISSAKSVENDTEMSTENIDKSQARKQNDKEEDTDVDESKQAGDFSGVTDNIEELCKETVSDSEEKIKIDHEGENNTVNIESEDLSQLQIGQDSKDITRTTEETIAVINTNASSIIQKEAKESTDEDSSLEHIEFKPSEEDELKIKVPLSADHILLESVPKTPTMIVQDSIIFESESVSPVHFASVEEIRGRQRRAHTIECVMPGGLKRLDDGNIASKEWRSYDDIDKMDTTSSGIGLFQPIRKLAQDNKSGDSDEKINDLPEIGRDDSRGKSNDLVLNQNLVQEKVDDNNAILMNEPMVTSLKSISSDASFSFEVLSENEYGDTQSNILTENLVPVSPDFVGRLEESERFHLQSEQVANNYFADTPRSDDQRVTLASDPSIEVIDNMSENQVIESEKALSIFEDEKENTDTVLHETNIVNNTIQNDTVEIGKEQGTVEYIDPDLSQQTSMSETSGKGSDIGQQTELRTFEEKGEHIFIDDTFQKHEQLGVNEKGKVADEGELMAFNNAFESISEKSDTDYEENPVKIKDFETVKNDSTDVSISDVQGNITDSSNLLNLDINNSIVDKHSFNDQDTTPGINAESLVMSPELGECNNKQIIKPPGFSFLDDVEDDQQNNTTSSSDSSNDDSYNQFSGLLLDSSTPTTSGVIDPYKTNTGQQLGEQHTTQSYDILNLQDSINTETSGSFGLVQEPIIDFSIPLNAPQLMLSTDSSMHSWELVSENSENDISLNKDEENINNTMNMANVDLLGLSSETPLQYDSSIPESQKVSESYDITDLSGGRLGNSNSQEIPVLTENNDLLNFQSPPNINVGIVDKDENPDASWDVLDEDTEA